MPTKSLPAIAVKMGKLFMFMMLFYTGGMKAQSYVAPYPATDLGQSLLISSTHPDWTDMQTAAASVRAETQDYIDNCTGTCPPPTTIQEGCSGDVCCYTYGTWNGSGYTYTTNCYNIAMGLHLCTIVQ